MSFLFTDYEKLREKQDRMNASNKEKQGSFHAEQKRTQSARYAASRAKMSSIIEAVKPRGRKHIKGSDSQPESDGGQNVKNKSSSSCDKKSSKRDTLPKVFILFCFYYCDRIPSTVFRYL